MNIEFNSLNDCFIGVKINNGDSIDLFNTNLIVCIDNALIYRNKRWFLWHLMISEVRLALSADEGKHVNI